MTDSQHDKLVQDAIHGDRGSLEQLLLMHCDSLSDHIRPKLAGPIESLVSVEDILQETFYRAFQQIASFEPKSSQSFLAWLKVIAESRIVDAIKNLKRKKRGGDFQRVANQPAAAQESVIELIQMISADGSSPSQIVAGDEAVLAMQVAVAALPEDQRQAIVLRYFQQMSLDETAAAMEKTSDAVRGLLHRAKKALRTHMHSSSIWFSRK